MTRRVGGLHRVAGDQPSTDGVVEGHTERSAAVGGAKTALEEVGPEMLDVRRPETVEADLADGGDDVSFVSPLAGQGQRPNDVQPLLPGDPFGYEVAERGPPGGCYGPRTASLLERLDLGCHRRLGLAGDVGGGRPSRPVRRPSTPGHATARRCPRRSSNGRWRPALPCACSSSQRAYRLRAARSAWRAAPPASPWRSTTPGRHRRWHRRGSARS